MNYLITGGAGFIGSHFCEEILRKEQTARITVIDNLSTGLRENLPADDSINFIQADVTDQALLDKIFADNSFDYIIHLAAIASVQDSIIDPVATHRVNFDSTLSLLELARKHKNLRRFVFASSAAVYGDKPSFPCNISDAVNPLTPYGVDKYASERYVVNSSKLFNLPATAFRFFNIYGPRQNPSSPYSGVVSIFAERFKNEQPQLKIFGDGEQTRDFVYVKDLVEIVLASFANDMSIGKVFNVCTGKETSLSDVVGVFEKISGKKAGVTYCERRAGDIVRSVGNNAEIVNAGFINSFTDIKSGLTELWRSLN